MKRMMVGLGVAALLIAAALGGGSLWLAYRQHVNREAFAIADAGGVQEAGFVRIGEIDQWVTIRGRNRGNPILLILHGGPGFPTTELVRAFQPLEDDFTIVQFDQRGAGRTFGRSGAVDVTIERMTADAIQIAKYAGKRLGQEKVVVLGVSWGSTLGVRMAKARPDLIHAYVGTGQMVDVPEAEKRNYAQVMTKARAQDDAKAMADLERIGPPPYGGLSEMAVQRKWAATYETGAPSTLRMMVEYLTAPGFRLGDLKTMLDGSRVSQGILYGDDLSGPANAINLRELGPEFAVPIIVIQGEADDFSPTSLAREWVDELSAPDKAFIVLPNAGHYALITQAETFQGVLRQRVRPLALKP